MPPIRNYPMPAKPVKTERSHEENQERAYIAASRRSDRSLEARVESARRASEIHKRRTGRSLRVTEQDVVNEEMYEEEDDDLPNQYRRLAQHLNVNSSDLNRRLAAFLTSNNASRQALTFAMTNGQAQHGPPWSPNNPQMFNHGPFSNPFMMGSGFFPNSTMIQPNMMHRHNPSIGQSSYPSNTDQGMEADGNRPRPASIATDHPVHGLTSPTSALNSPATNFPFGAQQPNAGSPKNRSSRSPTSAKIAQADQTVKPGESEPNNGNVQQSVASQDGAYNMQQPPWSGGPPAMMSPTSPLTTEMPPNVQMFLSPSMNTSFDAFNQQPFYNYNPNFANKKSSNTQMSNGMSETLAPAAFESKMVPTSWPTPPSSEEQAPTYPATDSMNFGAGDNSMFSTDFGQSSFDGFFGDGQPSPMDDFSAFIDDACFDDTPNAAA